jgi:hypothetical protein
MFWSFLVLAVVAGLTFPACFMGICWLIGLVEKRQKPGGLYLVISRMGKPVSSEQWAVGKVPLPPTAH